MTAGLLDCIVTPKQGQAIPDGAWFCADNGVFGKGYPGDDLWWAWVQTLPREHCRFVVAPDVVADAAATIIRSTPWLGRIRALGLPAAFVGQDGLQDLSVPWDDFDVFFIGGSTDWKIGPHARALAAEAKRRGKQVHMGRVNSLKRLDYAHLIGCDSTDGTFITFAPDANLPKMLRWLTAVHGPRVRIEARQGGHHVLCSACPPQPGQANLTPNNGPTFSIVYISADLRRAQVARDAHSATTTHKENARHE